MAETEQQVDEIPPGAVPLYIDDCEPEIDDPSLAAARHKWLPADPVTVKLVRSLEALRDVRTALSPLTQLDGEPDKRHVKQTIVPVYNFATAVRDLFNDVQSNSWKRPSAKEQRELARQFRLFGQRVPTDKGPLKTARNKIAAHLDKDVFSSGTRQVWDQFDLTTVLGWARGCAEMLVALLEPEVYSWARESGHPKLHTIMNVDGSQVRLLDHEVNGLTLVDITMTRSPKYGIAREVRGLIDLMETIKVKFKIQSGTVWRLPE
jgi:hypothetical protein